MGMFSSDFWEDFYAQNGHDWYKNSGRFNQRDVNSWISDQMHRKNMETDGGYQAKVSGDTGELVLSSVMRSLPDCYHVLDNILLQTKNGSTQLDHVIVSPYGIFVIETKNHKGIIFGDCFGRVWTQVLNGAGKFKFYSPVLQNAGHIRHLSSQTRIPMQFMQGVIVFTNPDANLVNVNCPFCFTVESLYEYITRFRSIVFTDKQVEKAIQRMDKVDTNSYMNRRKHVEHVNNIKQRRGY